jgi:DHA3 family tetracycline resistance protein-like MFS transporter
MTVSLVGDGIFLIAMTWVAYQLWNAPAALSVLGIAMTVPTIVCLLAGGVVSDRFERRLVVLWSDLIRSVAVGALAVLSLAPALRTWSWRQSSPSTAPGPVLRTGIRVDRARDR